MRHLEPYISSYFYLSHSFGKGCRCGGNTKRLGQAESKNYFYFFSIFIPPFNTQNIGIPVYATLCCILTTTWQDSKSKEI